ncbi:glycoside hydrolase family 128 protein [Dothidotthia symphoricarpi CBS 119687]|uniref:Glycoside hydrolase family 128 protein n=1 Tax=Dothidotthia symphoricarpi CBS 119687 TaxID=1392245 RepID=A0A6A6AS37_9PLEO|nr:glycoside hydrolase family 128 protein [Dothidotthia symphoricarpi CBS 119687]KAF2134802.1 glycoside hydrolase family 128 protein [Dothidotthia symphoricarpi CBS 119687]
MSSTMKISLLALISTAAAVPQYGHAGHSKFHSSHKASQAYGTGSGRPAYPTGGWSGGYNGTSVPQATGTGAYPDDKTTTVGQTLTSTQVVVSTIYGTASSDVPVAAEEVSTGASQCGLTVTVTSAEKVTVTVTKGSGASSTAASAGVSSVASVESDYGYETSAASYEVPASSYEASASSYVVVTPTPVAASSKVVEATSSQVADVTSSKAADVTSSKADGYAVPTSVDVSMSFAQKPVAAKSSAAASSAVVSSAKASATGSSPTYSGSKRGLAYNDASLCKALSGSYGYAYNWGQTESASIGAPFVPMMHKPSDSTAEAWLANVDTAVKAGTKAVMGFNEPDVAAQANMTPEAACTSWMEYMNPIASSHSDVTILGPSVSNGVGTDAAPMGLNWLTDFHTACPDAIVHATNIHFYDIPSDETITRFKTQIEKAAALYSKPVWVTEFGLNTGSATDAQAASFLKQAMEYMDGSDLVEGYSYFMVADGADMLNADTLVGQAYAASTY